jgi:hypothetical protein
MPELWSHPKELSLINPTIILGADLTVLARVAPSFLATPSRQRVSICLFRKYGVVRFAMGTPITLEIASGDQPG